MRWPAKSRIILILATLAFVGVWKGYNLSQRGLLEHDEGHNLLAARTYSDVARWLVWRHGGEDLAQVKATLHRQGGTLYPAGKPGFIGILALASLPAGQVSQSLGLWLAWAAGMLVTALAGAVAYVWTRGKLHCAILAVIGVGTSPLLGYLSREVGGTIWSLAWGMAALLLLQNQSRRLAALAGGCFALGFTCHYNLLPLIAAALAVDVARNWAGGPFRRQQVARYGALAAGMLLILIVCQVASMAAEMKLRAVHPKYEDYGSELLRIVTTYQLPALRGQAVGEGVRGWGADAWIYMGRVARIEGIAAALGFLLLIILRVIQPANPGLRAPVSHAFVFLFVLLLFWMLHPWKVERSWGGIVIGIWLMGAVLSTKLEQLPRAGVLILLPLFLAAHCAELAYGPWRVLWSQRSPIPGVVRDTLRYMPQHGRRINASSAAKSFAPLWKWAVVEELRNPSLALASKLVDFSSFEEPDILFLDPATGRDPQITDLIAARGRGKSISEAQSQFPLWRVSAQDIGQ